MLLLRKAGEMGWHAPKITAYPNELALETLIAQSPDLLPGTAGQPMVVATQLTVPLIGYVDLVGVDLDGNLTIVECKLESNPEIRRKVIGQVFAYAAGLWKLSYESFDQAFTDRHGKPLAQAVADLNVDEWDEEGFRASVGSNLAAGRFRLVIAVDRITDELKQIILYLNQHTVADLQILALELGYVADEGVEVLLPVVYGEESAQTKAAGPTTTTPRKWDQESMFATLKQDCSPATLQLARQLYDYAIGRGAVPSWGKTVLPSVTMRFPLGNTTVSAINLCEWPKGKGSLYVYFGNLLEAGVPTAALSTLAERLREIEGVTFKGLEKDGFNKYPGIPFDQLLQQPDAVNIVHAAVDEVLGAASIAPADAVP